MEADTRKAVALMAFLAVTRKYDAARTVAAFSATLRNEVDLLFPRLLAQLPL